MLPDCEAPLRSEPLVQAGRTPCGRVPRLRHVRLLGLDRTNDGKIWEHAAREDFTIVSKDADFQQLAMLPGPPPKVIWITLGNFQVDAVDTLLRQSVPAVPEFVADPALAVLALPVQLIP